MLKTLRHKNAKYLQYLFFGAIIIVFVGWGVERFNNPIGGAAAVVDGETISMTEYRNALQRMIEFYSQMMQGNFDERAQKQFRIKENALQQLVQSHVISKESYKLGLRAEDDEVRKTLKSIEFLNKDGRFSRETYDALLSHYRMSAPQFEETLKRDAINEKARRLFEMGILESALMKEKDEKIKEARSNAEFLKIEGSQIEKAVSVSDAQASAFASDPKNQSRIKEYFDLHKEEFSQPEQVKARHILVKAKKGDASEEAKAKETLAKIKSEMATQKFEDLAKKYSEDPGSKDKGGDLGFFSKGRMVPEFENAAFSTEAGKTTEPIQTVYGFHIIKVEAKKAASSTSFESAKVGIAKKLEMENEVSKFISDTEALIAKEPQKAATRIMTASKGKWEETGNFTPADESIPKVGPNEDILNGLMKLSVEKPYAEKIYKMGDSYYLFRYKSPQAQPAQAKAVGPGEGKELGRSIFSNWVSSMAKSASVKPNPQLFDQEAEF